MMQNLPSLSELLSAYNTPGLGAAINQGTQGVVSGMKLGAERQKAQLDQQNKLAELANQGISANASATSAQAAMNSAAASQQEAANKLVPVETAERYAGAPAGTFGPAGTSVPVSAANDYLTRKSQQENVAAQIAANASNKALLAHQQELDAQLKAQTLAAQTAERQKANQNTVGSNMVDQGAKNAPGIMGEVANMGYHLLPWTQGDLPKVAAYKEQQAMGRALMNGQQPVFGQTPAAQKPAYTATATHADGTKIGYNAATNQWEPIQ